MLRGIDISNWQRGIYVPGLDVDFCIAKATEGIGYEDPCFQGFAHDCITHQILFGFYHFARENNPEKEAEYFYDRTSYLIGYGIPFLDYETFNANDCDWCKRFCKRFNELSGIWPVLYTYVAKLPYLRNFEYVDECPLWIAGYPWANPSWTDSTCPYDCAPWNRPIIWQYTSSLQIDGWRGQLDGNISYIDAPEWERIAKGDEYDMITDDDARKIARYVWEYQYVAPDGTRDDILQQVGYPKESDSNRYNVLNAIIKKVFGIDR